jgi:two-component system sensor histidine kinase DesK
MDSRTQGVPDRPMAGTARAVLLVRIVAILSVLPLLLSIAALWSHPPRGLEVPIQTAPHAPAWVGTAFIALAMGCYLLYWLRVWPVRRPVWTGALLIAVTAMVTLDQALALTPATELWLYVAVVAGAALRPALVAPAVLLLVVLSEAMRIRTLPAPPGIPGSPATWTDTLQVWLPLAAASVTQLATGALSGMLVTFLVRTSDELYAARSGLARLAVEEERARLARDLHDLLGQSLLLMAVKLELAGRLIGGHDRPGGQEIREVQRMARDALRDVREVVGGYRQPTLEGELAGAAVALEAAGITLELSDHHGVLTPALEATCAWLVREGVTNVIKHSGARTCEIGLERRDGELTVRVTDDGSRRRLNGNGMGIPGLGERVAAVGGTLTAGPTAAGGGFQLVARLPVDTSTATDEPD